MLRTFSTMLVLHLTALTLSAGEFNKVLSPGSKSPDFQNLDGADGKKHSLSEWKDLPCLVVIFTCNSCPVANAYEERIAAIAKTYAEAKDAKVAIVAINSNTIADDTLDKMTDRAKKKKYRYAYLHDPTQKTAKEFGAIYTPEFFVLNAERKVTYLGSLDDKNKADDAKVNYLDLAIQATLAGSKPETGETLARGCKIRFNP
jgi:peroxiredoxin